MRIVRELGVNGKHIRFSFNHKTGEHFIGWYSNNVELLSAKSKDFDSLINSFEKKCKGSLYYNSDL